MYLARAASVSLVLLSALGPIACGGDDPESPSTSSSSSSGGGGTPDASVPDVPDATPERDASADAAPDSGPGVADFAHGVLYLKGTEEARQIRFVDPLDALGAADASPVIDENWWSGIVSTASGEHFMYGDEDGRVLVGHARRDGAAADATGLPLADGAFGRSNATLLEDGTLIHAGQYFEAGKIDVFRAGARVSTGVGRADADDLIESTVTVYGAGPSVAWSYSSGFETHTYAAWGHAPGVEVEIADVEDVDALSPATDCLTALSGLTTKIACRGQTPQDLGPAVGSLAAVWHGSAERFAGLKPLGSNGVMVATRGNASWTVSQAGAASDVQLLGRSPNGDRVVYRSEEAPLNVLDLSQERTDYAAAVVKPAVPASFDALEVLFAPDGARAVAVGSSAAYLISPSATAVLPLQVANATATLGAAWSPDGTRVLLAARVGDAVVVTVFGSDGVLRTTLALPEPTEIRWASNEHVAFLDRADALRIIAADGSGDIPAPVDTGVVRLLAGVYVGGR